jgi:hypothetical protein
LIFGVNLADEVAEHEAEEEADAGYAGERDQSSDKDRTFGEATEDEAHGAGGSVLRGQGDGINVSGGGRFVDEERQRPFTQQARLARGKNSSGKAAWKRTSG